MHDALRQLFRTFIQNLAQRSCTCRETARPPSKVGLPGLNQPRVLGTGIVRSPLRRSAGGLGCAGAQAYPDRSYDFDDTSFFASA